MMQIQTMDIQLETLETTVLPRSDEELMLLYARGDGQAFDALFERHKRSVYSFIRKFMVSGDLADDLFQQVFMKVIHNRERYQPSAKFSTWLFTITRSVCIDAMRKNGKRRWISIFSRSEPSEEPGEPMAIACSDPTPRQWLQEQELSGIMQEIISTLPENQREVLLLRENTDLTFAEIAEVTGCSVNTVKSRMHYALLALRRGLEERGIA